MKYSDKKVEGIKKATLKKLETIAMNYSETLDERGGIDIRHNDGDDFPEVSIWAVQSMLEAAYLLGRSDKDE